MIESHNRSGWFGASDTDKIIGNWATRSWTDWWLEKLGFPQRRIETLAMNAGTHWEHRILDAIDPMMEKDRQVIISDLFLRVNLDGNTNDTIHEVKTYSAAKTFKVPPKYWRQVQVQMFATGFRKAKIQAYGLMEEEYHNYFLPVDLKRLETFDIEYDPAFITNKYLPKLERLAECLREGRIPEEARITKWA